MAQSRCAHTATRPKGTIVAACHSLAPGSLLSARDSARAHPLAITDCSLPMTSEAHISQMLDYRCHTQRNGVASSDRDLATTTVKEGRLSAGHSGVLASGTNLGGWGEVGIQFPPKLRTCLQSVANGSAFSGGGTWVVAPPRVFSPYRISACCHEVVACVPRQLQQRAEELLRDGFEAVLARLVPKFANRSAVVPRCGRWIGRNNKPIPMPSRVGVKY